MLCGNDLQRALRMLASEIGAPPAQLELLVVGGDVSNWPVECPECENLTWIPVEVQAAHPARERVGPDDPEPTLGLCNTNQFVSGIIGSTEAKTDRAGNLGVICETYTGDGSSHRLTDASVHIGRSADVGPGDLFGERDDATRYQRYRNIALAPDMAGVAPNEPIEELLGQTYMFPPTQSELFCPPGRYLVGIAASATDPRWRGGPRIGEVQAIECARWDDPRDVVARKPVRPIGKSPELATEWTRCDEGEVAVGARFATARAYWPDGVTYVTQATTGIELLCAPRR